MLGAIAGDIIGSIYEGNPIKTTDFPLFQASSRFTDDTVLTVATADAILNGIDYADAYGSYFRRYPNAGYGLSFIQWTSQPTQSPYGSWGNGSAMRVSPVGWVEDTLERVLARSEASASVSHNHPEGIKGAQATATAVFLARREKSKESIRTALEERFGYDLSRPLDDIRPTYHFDISCQGSVPQAIRAFLEGESFEDAVRLAVSLGGDSDTQACIAGAIAEAFFGGVSSEIERETLERLDVPLRQVVETFRGRYQQ